MKLPRSKPARIALYSIGGLFAVLFIAVAGLLTWVSVADLRPLVLSQIEKNTGLKVQISGPFTLQLFPSVVVDVEGLTVPAFKGEGNLLTTEHARLEAGWGSFPRIWQGIALNQFTLENPTINLVQYADGTTNYTPPASTQTTTEQPAPTTAAPSEFPLRSLGQVNITGLNLTYRNVSTSQVVNARGVALNVDARDLAATRATLTGSVNNQPISGNLAVGLTEALAGTPKTLPVEVTLTAASLKAAATGTIDTEKSGFTGTFSASAPNLKAALDALTTNAPAGTPADPMAIAGQVAYSGQQVALKGFNANVGSLLKAGGDLTAQWGDKVQASGQITASGSNLRTLARIGGYAGAVPATPFTLQGRLAGEDSIAFKGTAALTGLAGLNADLTLKPEDGKLPAVAGTVALTSPNVKALAEGFGVTASVPAAPLSLQTQVQGQGTYELKNLAAELTGLAKLVSNDLTVTVKENALPEAAGTLRISGPSLAAVGKQMGLAQQLPARAFTAETALTSGNNSYTLSNLKAAIDGLLAANGKLTLKMADQPEYTGNLSVTGPSTVAVASAFGMEAGSLPATSFSASTDVEGKGAIKLPNLKVNLPQLLEATGNLTYTPGTRADVQSTLNVSRLNLDALGICNPPPAVSAAKSSDIKAPPTTEAPWTDDPISTSFLNDMTFNLKAEVKGITCARAPLTSVAAQLVNTADTLTIQQLDAAIGAGTIGVKGTLAHSGTPVLNMTLAGSKIAVEELVSTLKERGVVLPLDVNAAITSRGNTQRQLVSNLSGTLKATANSGRVPYTNLLGNAATIQNLLRNGISGAQPVKNDGTLNRLNADYTITGGVLNTNELAVETDGGNFKLNGTGTVNLPLWQIDYTLTPAVLGGNEKTLSIPVHVKGALSSPAIGADPAFVLKLTTRLATQGLEEVLGEGSDEAKNLGKAVGGILSGQGVDKEAVGNLIGGFLNKRKPAEASPTDTAPAETTTTETVPAAQ